MMFYCKEREDKMSLTQDRTKFRCMACRVMVYVQGADVGKRIACPRCGFTLFVPSVHNAPDEYFRDRLSVEKRKQLRTMQTAQDGAIYL